VEVTVAIVEAAAAIAAPVAAIRNPEHALDGTHRAADAGPYRAANHATHWAGDPVAFRGTLLRATHDALRMAKMGDCNQCENECRCRELESGRQRRCPDLRLHLISLIIGRECAEAA
jgi:hypothetical protein